MRGFSCPTHLRTTVDTHPGCVKQQHLVPAVAALGIATALGWVAVGLVPPAEPTTVAPIEVNVDDKPEPGGRTKVGSGGEPGNGDSEGRGEHTQGATVGAEPTPPPPSQPAGDDDAGPGVEGEGADDNPADDADGQGSNGGD